jgi:type I restriction enzyme S subunit
MNAGSSITLDEIMPTGLRSVEPSRFPEEKFDLYSVPAFDRGEPEILEGSRIGSVKQVVEPGDVLLSRIVPHIRRAWIVGNQRGRRIIASGEWIVLRGQSVEPRYLRHVLVADRFHAEFMQTVAGVGGSLLRARPAHVAKIRIPLPPLRNQRRIADILDQGEALRAKRRDALVQLNALTQSIFLEMFGDPATNPKGWQKRQIGELLETASYGTSEKALDVGEFPVLRMNNITRSGEMELSALKYMDLKEDQHERYLVRRGDILFNRTNSADLVGKTAIYRHDTPMAYAGYLIRLRVDANNDPEYLAAFLNTSYSKRVLRGMCKSIIGMANINAKEVQSIRIGQPPTPLQRQFGLRIQRVEKLKNEYRRLISGDHSLIASLQDRAFRGEL